MREAALTYIAKTKEGSSALFIQFLDDIYDRRDDGDYQIVIDEFKRSEASLDWLLTQTVPPLLLKLDADNVPTFRSVANLVERRVDIDKSSIVTYQGFKNGSKEPDFEGSYKKYKQVRVLPAVGIAYIPCIRTASTFNETTKLFENGSTFSNVEALIGVKWYAPFFGPKTNPARSGATRTLIDEAIGPKANQIRGNGFTNTLFLTAGLGISHNFLRNYYVGIGGDIVPGLSLHAGGNFILKKYYQLENGKMLSQQERPAGFFYVSLSVDPGIAGSLIKLLLPAK